MRKRKGKMKKWRGEIATFMNINQNERNRDEDRDRHMQRQKDKETDNQKWCVCVCVSSDGLQSERPYIARADDEFAFQETISSQSIV